MEDFDIAQEYTDADFDRMLTPLYDKKDIRSSTSLNIETRSSTTTRWKSCAKSISDERRKKSGAKITTFYNNLQGAKGHEQV